MKKTLLATLIALCTLAASVGAAMACNWGFYQPEVPETLRK